MARACGGEVAGRRPGPEDDRGKQLTRDGNGSVRGDKHAGSNLGVRIVPLNRTPLARNLLFKLAMSTEPMPSLDATFLALESRDVPFVFACVIELDRPIDVVALRERIDAALTGRYRQHMKRTWHGVYWVDDDEFDVERHVDTASVAPPGDAAAVDALAAELLERELPAGHSPWHVSTVTGLADNRGALVVTVHHSLVDGIAGIRMLEQVVAGTAPPTRPRAPRAKPAARSSPLRKLLTLHHLKALARLLRDGLRPASNIGLNPRRTGRERVVARHAVQLADIAAIQEAFAVSNNDVVLATVAGALRRFLLRRGLDVAKLDDVRAMVPVGRYANEPRATWGNRVALLLCKLPIDEPDPVARLARVTKTTRTLKRSHLVDGGDLLVALSDITTPALLAGVFRVALRLRAFNTIVTNVPGPREPLTLLGTRITRITPIVNLWPHQALGVAVVSYANEQTFGLQGDRAVIPDVAAFREDLAASFQELRNRVTAPPIAVSQPLAQPSA